MPAPAPFLAVTDLRSGSLTPAELTAALPRPELDVEAAAAAVRPVVEDVAARGAEAVLEASERFDGIRPEHLRVPQGAMQRALEELDPAIRAALEESAVRVRRVDAAQKRPAESVEVVPGGTVTQRWVPVRRVGLYVPGGRAVLPSSVVMNVVPAQVAGVEQIVLASPPQKEVGGLPHPTILPACALLGVTEVLPAGRAVLPSAGVMTVVPAQVAGVEQIVLASPPQKEFGGLPHPTILAACALLGVTEVLAAGGAQAIALLAHGADDLGDGTALEGVDLVTGPGNVYVAAAKRLVRGTVGIDAEAGPTEIAILADGNAHPGYVAADLISQAEHDPLAASVLVTDSPELVAAVEAELAVQVPAALHHERIATALRG